jgi:hypothetical protein
MQNPSDQETIREIRIYILSAQDSGIAAILGTALILNDFPLAKDELLAAEWKSHVDAFAQEFKSGADPAYMRALNLLRLGQPEAAELEMQSVSEEQILLFEWLKDAWERARRESAVKGQRSI